MPSKTLEDARKKILEQMEDSIRRREEKVKLEEERQKKMRSSLQLEHSQLLKDKADFRRYRSEIEIKIDRRLSELEKKESEVDDRNNLLKEEKEELKKKQKIFETKFKEMRIKQEWFNDEVRQWKLSMEQADLEHKAFEAKLKEKEAELANKEATRYDEDQLISKRAAAQREFDDLERKDENAKPDLEDLVQNPSLSSLGTSTSEPSNSDNQVTNSESVANSSLTCPTSTISTKRRKAEPRSKWDKVNGVRVCQLCPKENPFANKDNRKVREHIYYKHHQGKSYVCSHCGKSFTRTDGLQKHKKICVKRKRK